MVTGALKCFLKSAYIRTEGGYSGEISNIYVYGLDQFWSILLSIFSSEEDKCFINEVILMEKGRLVIPCISWFSWGQLNGTVKDTYFRQALLTIKSCAPISISLHLLFLFLHISTHVITFRTLLFPFFPSSQHILCTRFSEASLILLEILFSGPLPNVSWGLIKLHWSVSFLLFVHFFQIC